MKKNAYCQHYHLQSGRENFFQTGQLKVLFRSPEKNFFFLLLFFNPSVFFYSRAKMSRFNHTYDLGNIVGSSPCNSGHSITKHTNILSCKLACTPFLLRIGLGSYVHSYIPWLAWFIKMLWEKGSTKKGNFLLLHSFSMSCSGPDSPEDIMYIFIYMVHEIY